jgi:hypothetical protein
MSKPGVQTKAFDTSQVNLTPGERSDVSWITTDVVDNEGDVVIARGVDLSVFTKNPVVMAVHNYQSWPLGRCDWIKPAKTKGFAGLTAKTLWDEDPDALRLFGMVQRGLVKGRSIGFRPPDDFKPSDWGPPSPEELKARPDWAAARRVIRRCVLLEYSVCPIPMNQESLTLAVSKALSLGLEVPTYLRGMAGAGGCKAGPPGAALPPHRTLAEVQADIDGQIARAMEPGPDRLALPPHRTLEEVQADLIARITQAIDPAKVAEAAARAAAERARRAT